MQLDKTKQYVIVDNFLEIVGENECKLHNLSESTIQLALNALACFDWPSRWLTVVGEDLARISYSSFLLYRQSYLEKAIKELTMSCNDDIVLALNQINATLNDKLGSIGGGGGGCGCSGTRGAGDHPADPSDIDDSLREEPPPYFEDWAAWDQHKCDVAWQIYQEIRADIGAWGLISAGLTSIATILPLLITALLTPIPLDELTIMIFLALELFAIAGIVSTLQGILDDHYGDIICALFTANTVNDAIQSYISLISDYVEETTEITTVGPLAVDSAKKYLSGFATTDSFNRLFSDFPPTNTGNDCSTCPDEDCPVIVVTYGTVISGEPNADGVAFTVRGADEAGYSKIFIETSDTPCGPEDVCWNITAMEGIGGTGGNIWSLELQANVWTWADTWEALLAGLWQGEYGVFYGEDANPIEMTFIIQKLDGNSDCESA